MEEQEVFATRIVGLATFPLLGREEALLQTSELLFKRWQKRMRTTDSDRTVNPFIFFPASPGLGKTRMLNVLTRIPKQPSEHSWSLFKQGINNLKAKLPDDELKWAVLEKIRLNLGNVRDSWPTSAAEDIDTFCEVLRNQTCGIVITFNGRTNLGIDEREGKVLATEMLGIRVAFETKLVNGCNYDDFAVFREDLKHRLEERPTLSWALNQVFKRVGDDKQIILGVDEILLGAGVGDYEQYRKADEGRLKQMLDSLGVELDRRKNLHLVLTSLSYIYFRSQQTVSGRNVIAVPLRNLSFEESMVLGEYYSELNKIPPEQRWLNDRHAKQIVEDCDGAPRLLENVFTYLRPNKSLQELRALCSREEPISKLNARNRLMVVALVLSLRGMGPRTDGEQRCFDEAVYMGYLLSSSVSVSEEEEEPIFPLMSMWCVCENAKLRKTDDVFDLWEMIQRVLRFDSDMMGNEFAGRSFEAFFRALWRLRCKTRCFQVFVNKEHGATARFGSQKETTMETLLTSYDYRPDFVEPTDGSTSAFTMRLEILDAPKEVTFGGLGPHYSKLTLELVCAQDGHCIITPTNPNEPGLDNVFTFNLRSQRIKVGNKAINAGKKVAVFAVQYKFSSPGKTTTISIDDISTSVITSIKTNIVAFRNAIDDGVFGYLFISATPYNQNVSASAVRDQILVKLRDMVDLGEDNKMAISRAASQVALLDRRALLHGFIPRSFRSRPQFRLERPFGGSL